MPLARHLLRGLNFSSGMAAAARSSMAELMRVIFADDPDTLSLLMKAADVTRARGNEPANTLGFTALVLQYENSPDGVALLWRIHELLDQFMRESIPFLDAPHKDLVSKLEINYVRRYTADKCIHLHAVGLLLAAMEDLFIASNKSSRTEETEETYRLSGALGDHNFALVEECMHTDLSSVYYLSIIQSAVRIARAILDIWCT